MGKISWVCKNFGPSHYKLDYMLANVEKYGITTAAHFHNNSPSGWRKAIKKKQALAILAKHEGGGDV